MMTADYALRMRRLRPILRELVHLLEFRIPDRRHCWITSEGARTALVVPVLGTSYDWIRTFSHYTVHEAVVLGVVRLDGPEQMPAYSYGPGPFQWKRDQPRYGQIITLNPAYVASDQLREMQAEVRR